MFRSRQRPFRTERSTFNPYFPGCNIIFTAARRPNPLPCTFVLFQRVVCSGCLGMGLFRREGHHLLPQHASLRCNITSEEGGSIPACAGICARGFGPVTTLYFRLCLPYVSFPAALVLNGYPFQQEPGGGAKGLRPTVRFGFFLRL